MHCDGQWGSDAGVSTEPCSFGYVLVHMGPGAHIGLDPLAQMGPRFTAAAARGERAAVRAGAKMAAAPWKQAATRGGNVGRSSRAFRIFELRLEWLRIFAMGHGP